jgi:hypothetical protein
MDYGFNDDDDLQSDDEDFIFGKGNGVSAKKEFAETDFNQAAANKYSEKNKKAMIGAGAVAAVSNTPNAEHMAMIKSKYRELQGFVGVNEGTSPFLYYLQPNSLLFVLLHNSASFCSILLHSASFCCSCPFYSLFFLFSLHSGLLFALLDSVSPFPLPKMKSSSSDCKSSSSLKP